MDLEKDLGNGYENENFNPALGGEERQSENSPDLKIFPVSCNT